MWTQACGFAYPLKKYLVLLLALVSLSINPALHAEEDTNFIDTNSWEVSKSQFQSWFPSQESHPSVLITPDNLAEVRSKINREPFLTWYRQLANRYKHVPGTHASLLTGSGHPEAEPTTAAFFHAFNWVVNGDTIDRDLAIQELLTQTMPPGIPSGNGLNYTRVLEAATGVKNYATAYDLMHNYIVANLTQAQHDKIRSDLKKGANYLLLGDDEFVSFNNWDWLQASALGVATLVLANEPEKNVWAEDVYLNLELYFGRLVSDTGALYEGLHYWNYPSSSFIPFLYSFNKVTGVNLTDKVFRHDNTVYASVGEHSKGWYHGSYSGTYTIGDVLDWTMETVMPSGYGPNIRDAHMEEVMFGAYVNRLWGNERASRARYLSDWTLAGLKGGMDTNTWWSGFELVAMVFYDENVPSDLGKVARHWADDQQVIFRSDWTHTANYAGLFNFHIFNHVQGDQNQFVLAANGVYVINDAGYGDLGFDDSYGGVGYGPDNKGYYFQPKVHNILLVDGYGPDEMGGGYTDSWWPNVYQDNYKGNINDKIRRTEPMLTNHRIQSGGYAIRYGQGNKAALKNTNLEYTRYLVSANNDYYVLYDEMDERGSGLHNYRFLFHGRDDNLHIDLSQNNTYATWVASSMTNPSGQQILPGVTGKVNMKMVNTPSSVSQGMGRGADASMSKFWGAEYAEDTTVLNVDFNNASDASFTSVWVPQAGSDSNATLTNMTVSNGAGVAYAKGGYQDYIYDGNNNGNSQLNWSDSSNSNSGNTGFALIRNFGGVADSGQFFRGSQLSTGGGITFSATTEIESLTWQVSNGRLEGELFSYASGSLSITAPGGAANVSFTAGQKKSFSFAVSINGQNSSSSSSSGLSSSRSSSLPNTSSSSSSPSTPMLSSSSTNSSSSTSSSGNTSGSVLVSQGKPVIASSEQVGNEVKYLTDGNLGTRWSASGYPQSAVIDLGASYNLTSTAVVTYQDRAYRYTIEVSNSANGPWTQVVNRSNNTTPGSVSTPLTDNFSANGRYVRLTVTGASGYSGSWISIPELGVYGNQNSSGSSLPASSSSRSSSISSSSKSSSLISSSASSKSSTPISSSSSIKSSSSSSGSNQGCSSYTDVTWNVKTEVTLNGGSKCLRFDRDLSGKTVQFWDSDSNTSCDFRGTAVSVDGSGSMNINSNYVSAQAFTGRVLKLNASPACDFIQIRTY